MNHFDKYSELIAKYLTGEIAPGEERELFAWTEAKPENQTFFEEMVKTWALTEGASTTPFEVNAEMAWEKIEQRIQPASGREATTRPINSSPKITALSKIVRRWSIAAAILIAIGAFAWWLSREPVQQNPLVEIQTFDREKKEVVLPDSSHVWLNENSKLVYDPKFELRKVTLEGEAFFQVERLEERPFKITSGEAITTVLGTSFNVRAYPAEDKIEVTVKTGKVALAVTREQAPPVLLNAGESGIFDKKEKKVEVAAKKNENADAWKTQLLSFNETLMKDIIETLNRYFNVQIEAENPLLLECHYSSTFPQPDLEGILTIIGSTLNFEYTKDGDRYLLSGKGCNPDQ